MNIYLEPLACIDELGNGIPNGEEVVNPRDPCKICTCEMGNLFCAEQICKIPVCRNFQHTEGTCCDGVCLDDMVKRSNLVGRVQISLPITAAFAPESQVIVFYVRSDGEVVSSSTRLEVEKCFDNKVVTLTIDLRQFCFIGKILFIRKVDPNYLLNKHLLGI